MKVSEICYVADRKRKWEPDQGETREREKIRATIVETRSKAKARFFISEMRSMLEIEGIYLFAYLIQLAAARRMRVLAAQKAGIGKEVVKREG